MASSRGRRKMMPRRRRIAKDWVYNDETYAPTIATQTVGLATAGCYRLFDSTHHMLNARGSALAPVHQHAHTRPDYRALKYFGLDGVIHMAPTNWALGVTFNIIFALLIIEQDPVDGACLLDPNFNLGSSSGLNNIPGLWANSHNVVKVWRMQQAFNTSNDSTTRQLPLRWYSRRGRTLRPEDGVFLYAELPTTVVAGAPVNMRFQMYLRSLVQRGVL